jgi:GNAT superfamily N-acetyltransferase
MEIRRVREGEAAVLSAIARASKSHWPYSPEQIEAWLPDLTASAEQIAAHPTFVAEVDGTAAAFFQLLAQPDTWVLEHLWVLPQHMGKGIGRALLQHAMSHAREGGAQCISIDADPCAEAFYAACGAETVGKTAAPIPGSLERVRPQMLLRLK